MPCCPAPSIGHARQMGGQTSERQQTGSEIDLFSSSGAEDLMSPRPPFQMKTPASVFARSIGGGPQSPVTAPFTPPGPDSPFASPGLRRLPAAGELCSPWHGTVQSPHLIRRAPKLWSTSTGERPAHAGGFHPARADDRCSALQTPRLAAAPCFSPSPFPVPNRRRSDPVRWPTSSTAQRSR